MSKSGANLPTGPQKMTPSEAFVETMVANKVRGIRAALCEREETARSSREHNDSNILVFAANIVTTAKAKKILEAWLATEHLGGSRHARRVRQIKKIEDMEYERIKKS